MGGDLPCRVPSMSDQVVLREAWALSLLGEGRVYSGWVGTSCSRHNPWAVDPDLRGVADRAQSGRSVRLGGCSIGRPRWRCRRALTAGTEPGAGRSWPAPTAAHGCQSGGSGTAVSDGDVLNLQRTTVAPQSSGGPRSPRRAGTSSIRGRGNGRGLRGIDAGVPGKAGEQRHRSWWSSQVPRDKAAGLG